MLKLAIFGAGRIGQVHGRNAAASNEIDLIAVADEFPAAAEALAAETGAAVRAIDDILADGAVEAILICTPTDTHADLSERAAAAGKAVFCEKPIDLSAERARACLERVDAAGAPFFVGFNRRFDPSFDELRRRLRAGAIGDLELLTITSRDPAPPPADYLARSGGLFRDMMIHDFDMACWLLDETPVSVFAAASALVDPAVAAAGDVDTAAVVLTMASGRICQISNSRRAVYGYDQRIEAHGSGGMLLAENHRETAVVAADASGYRRDPAQPFFLERYAEAYRLELAAFAKCVAGDLPPADWPTGADGLRAIAIADAATRSAKSGAPAPIAL